MLYVDSVMIAHRDLFANYFGLPRPTNWVRHSGSLWVDQQEMARISKAISRKLKSPWPERVLNKMRGDLVNLNHYLSGNVVSLDKKKVHQLIYKAWMSTYFPIMMGKVIDDEVSRLVASASFAFKEKIALLLNTPSKQTVQQKYFKELARIGWPRQKIDLKEVMERYKWINTYVMDIKPLTLKQVLFDIKIAAKKKGKEIETVKMTHLLKRLVKLGREYCWFRDWRLFEIGKFYFNFKKYLDLFGREHKLNYKQVRQLRVEELIKDKFNKADIRERIREFSILLLGDEIMVATGNKLKLVKKYIAEDVADVSMVKGMVANRGIVRGVVRLADSYNFQKLRKGEIVVTAETTPDAVPYLHSAKAIVTDEGGITSHAAIISRELRVPCIIGTKIGTKVFKTGDWVEVDANKGIVKLIKKSRL